MKDPKHKSIIEKIITTSQKNSENDIKHSDTEMKKSIAIAMIVYMVFHYDRDSRLNQTLNISSKMHSLIIERFKDDILRSISDSDLLSLLRIRNNELARRVRPYPLLLEDWKKLILGNFFIGIVEPEISLYIWDRILFSSSDMFERVPHNQNLPSIKNWMSWSIASLVLAVVRGVNPASYDKIVIKQSLIGVNLEAIKIELEFFRESNFPSRQPQTSCAFVNLIKRKEVDIECEDDTVSICEEDPLYNGQFADFDERINNWLQKRTGRVSIRRVRLRQSYKILNKL